MALFYRYEASSKDTIKHTVMKHFCLPACFGLFFMATFPDHVELEGLVLVVYVVHKRT